MSPAAALLDGIEARRRAIGLSQDALASAAQISGFWYRTIIKRPERATDAVLQRLRLALKAHGQSETQRLIAGYYDLLLALVSLELGLDVARVRAADPRRGATADREWLAAAKARQMAVYLLNTVRGVKQRHIAHAIGLTPAAICLACQSVEDARDDPAIDQVLNKLAALIAAEEGA